MEAMEVSEEKTVEPSSPMQTESIENAAINGDSSNHRRLLSEAAKLQNQTKFLDFAWVMEMPVEKVCWNPLSVLELDKDVQLPVSLQSIQCLKDISVKAFVGEEAVSLGPTPKQAWEIEESKTCGSTLENHSLSYVIKDYLKIPHDMDVTARFKKLVLYAGQQCFINNIGSWWVDGKFGTVLLQLPVEGGHEGGRLNVEYQGRKTKFESHANSDNIFYLSSFYDCCEHFIEPVLQGNKLMLVYDLIWKNAKIEIPQNFPLFLTVKKQIKKAFKSWLQCHLLKPQKEDAPEKSGKEKESLTKQSLLFTPGTQLVGHPDCPPPGFVVDSSLGVATKLLTCKIDSGKNEAGFLYSEEELKENILFVVLNEKYDEEFLAFELLRRGDRIFAEALLQCDHLQVNLALAKKTDIRVREEISVDQQFESHTKQEKAEVLEISCLIDSNSVARNLSIELKWDRQFIGSVQPNEQKVKNKDNEQVEVDRSCATYVVLVFWPKQYSVPIYCHFGLHSLLIRISKSLASLRGGEEDAVLCTKSDLRQLVLFCCAEPRKSWIKSGMEKGYLTLRLLRFCIALQAREEGLHLLRILASNFEDQHENGIADSERNFEGIQNEEVAHAIAIFGYQVAGWSVIADLIERMVSPNRITKQLIPFCTLAKSFLNGNCVEGAKMVANCISSFFHKIDKTQASKAKLCDVQAYVDMVVALETNRDTCNRERIETFVLFFSKLRPSLQCRIVLHFAAQKNPSLRSKHSWQFVFRDVCEILSGSCKIQSPPAKTIASDFMKSIKVWLLEVSQEIELRPELQEPLEPQIDLECAELKDEAIPTREPASKTSEESVTVNEEPERLLNSKVDKKSCQAGLELWNAPSDPNSKGDTSKKSSEWDPSADDWSIAADKTKTACSLTVSSTLECDSWDAASDAWASTTQSQITPAKTTKGSMSEDWGEKANACKTDSIEKEVVPLSTGTQPTDDWGACADAWASSGKTTTSSIQGGTSDRSQSDWGSSGNVAATSSTPIASADWDALPSYSNPTTFKAPYTPNSGSSSGWGASEDSWGAATGQSTSWTSQSTTWGSMENTGNSWTSSGYTARRGGGGRGTPRPCPKCNEEGHTSYDCPTRGRGRGNGATRGQRPCYKCNQEGHMSYDCPTAPTRGGRGGGRGRGVRVCYKCNQEGHMSYDCPTGPTGGRGGGRGSTRPFYQSTSETANSSNNQLAVDDWSTPTTVSNPRSSNFNASERYNGKGDAWGASSSTSDPWATPISTRDPWAPPNSNRDPWAPSNSTRDPWAPSNSTRDPWASNTNTASSGARNTSGYNVPSRNKKPEVDDWGTPSSLANTTPTSLPATSARRNETPTGPESDDWGVAADAWSSVTASNPSAPSMKPSVVAKVGGDDWAIDADAWSDRNGSASNVKVPAAANEINGWSDSRRPTVRSGNPSDPRLVPSGLSPFVWNGTISHRSLCFKISMENLDKNSSPDLANLAVPSTLKVVGTIEPEKVWSYLKQVEATSHEKVVVYTFTPTMNAEISYLDCYNYFVCGFRKANWFGVVGSFQDSKLSCIIKDFYIIPLPKEEPFPRDLEMVASAKFLRDHRVSDLLLAMIVIHNKRPVDQTGFGASTRPFKVARVETVIIPVEKPEEKSVTFQELDAATESQSAPSQPPSRLTAIRQKLQQDILSVDPVKARIHTGQQSVAKKPSSKSQTPDKLLPAVEATNQLAADESSNAILPDNKEATPSQVPIAEDKLQIPAAVDGELLMKQAIMEELNRQIEASKQGKLAEADPTLPSETLNSPSSIELAKPIVAETPSPASLISSDGPLTRSRTKRRPVAEDEPAVKRGRITTSSRSAHRSKANEDLRPKIEMLKTQRITRLSGRETGRHREARKRRCFVEGCRNDVQVNSIYCSDNCIVSHVQDSLNAMKKTKMGEAQLQGPPSGSNPLTPPTTSSDESAWKDSIDCSLLVSQPTPALAAKLLALTQMRKSMATAGTKPIDLAEDTPVPVLERTTGKILCGSSAPKVGSLEKWLKRNPTYEIIKPDSLPEKPWLPIKSTTAPIDVTSTASSSNAEVDGRSSKKSSNSTSSSNSKRSQKRSAEMSKEEESSTKVAKPDDESTRAISKSSLKEALWNRCKDVKDLETDEIAVEVIANEVEESLYSLFKQDVGTKYKSKYRSLIYNIKDPKNLGLFLEIVTKQITPVQLVKMSTEELASKDLAEWREREAKRQLDMIEKNEQERLSQVNKYLMKTHKGEEFIKEVNEDLDVLDEDTPKMNVVPDTSSEDSTSKQMMPKSDGHRSTLRFSQTNEEKDDKSTTSSHSSRKKKNELARSRRSKRSPRHSECHSRSHSRESDNPRSDRRLERRDLERHDSQSSSRTKTKDRHHSQRSDRDKKQERKKKIPEYAKAVRQPTESDGSKSIGLSDGEELSNPSQRLNANDGTPISAAESDTILLQNKLVKQLAVLEELSRESGSPEREFIDGLRTLEVFPDKEDSVMSECGEPSTITAQFSKSKEQDCELLEDGSHNGRKETVIVEKINQIDSDLEEHCDVRTLACQTSSLDKSQENVLYSPGKLLIDENDDSFLDLDEQFLKQQAIVEELNSSLTTFIVANNIDIQSHDEHLDSSFTEQTSTSTPGMPSSDSKDRDILELVEPSRSPPVEYCDKLGDILSTNAVSDQFKQTTSLLPIELDDTNSEKIATIVEKEESLPLLPA